MSTIELRNTIIQQLSKIEDVSFLNAIKTIVDSRVTSDYYQLSDFEMGRVSEARQDLKKSNTISNDDLQKEIEECLKEE